jgi:hypothetical protein
MSRDLVMTELKRVHGGGLHYVDSMTYGESKRVLYYAIATKDMYFAISDTLAGLLNKVRLGVSRGYNGVEMLDGKPFPEPH